MSCARSLLAEIRAFSEKMIPLAKASDTAEMTQLVLRRGQCVDRLVALPFDILDEASRESVLGELHLLEAQENRAETGLKTIVRDIERRMLAIHNNRRMLGEYRLSPEAGRRQSTRTDQA